MRNPASNTAASGTMIRGRGSTSRPTPIGLAGGTRPQGYVADPNGWIDPLGFAGCVHWDPKARRRRDSNGRVASEPALTPLTIPKALDSHRRARIVNRHNWGARKAYPDKTQFPKSWSDDRIIHNIQDVKDNPTSVTTGPWGQNVYHGERDGVKIVVDDYPSNSPNAGKISTGYPVP